MTRWGRRWSLIVCYLIGAIGALIAVAATVMASLPLLCAGLFVVGVGNSANALTRYVAADLRAPARRATMVGWIVWAGTIGAVVGPNLLSPSDRAGVSVGLPPLLAVAYFLCLLVFVAAAALYIIFLRPAPSSLSVASETEAAITDATTPGAARRPQVQIAVVALVFGRVVMVLIMTMTPLHLKAAGHSLDVIGLVASSHIVGMFLFAPLTGLLVDRLGAVPTIFAGQTVFLLAALGGLVVPVSRPLWIGAVLFFLGLGWNLGYVAGSASLTRGIPAAERPLLQGRVDSMVWVSAALASLLSSMLFSSIGFAGLCAVGAVAILVSSSTTAVRQRAVNQGARPS